MLKRLLSLLIAFGLLVASVAHAGEEIDPKKATPQQAAEWFQLGKVHFAEDTFYHKQNLDKAFDYFSRAAIAGNADALFYLASMYRQGKGAEEDGEKANFYYEMAARKGQPDAQFIMGLEHVKRGILYQEKTEAQDAAFKEAVRYLKPAAEKNHLEAMFLYADMQMKGLGTQKDEKKGLSMLRAAANAGNASACAMLAADYWQGFVVKKDLVQAYRWILIAQKQGNQEAEPLLAAIGAEMTEAQKKEATRLADAFIPKPLEQKASQPESTGK